MDDNTFKLLLAVVGTLQIVALAILANWQRVQHHKVDEVKTLVNGLAHEKDAAIAAAATKEGELIGRDFESAKHIAALVAAAVASAMAANAPAPIPVNIVSTEAPVPVIVKEGEATHGTK